MKILMLAEHSHPRIGGVEKHIKELNTVLSGWGHEIVLWVPRHNSQLPPFEQNENVDTYRVQFPESKWKRVLKAFFWWLRHIDLIRKADLVHFHGSFPFLHWFFPFRLFFPLKPMFVTYHGCGMTDPPLKREKIRNRLTQFFTRGNICIGHFLVKWHRLKPTFVSYGGVNVPPDFSSTKDKRAVYVGRLESDTGVELYMQALMLLKETYDLEIPLTVCGDGSMRPELETYCSDRGLDVNFVGFVENSQDFVKSSQFAFVSGYLSILEAMVSRCFVFSVYKNRIKEDYIRLFPDADRKMTINSDPAGLAKNLKEAWEDGAVFRERAERGESFACDQTWERLAKTYLRLWERS